MREVIIKNKQIFLFFLFSCFLFYGNSLVNKFALDDEYVTVTNKPINGQNYIANNKLVVKGIKGIPKIWQSRYAHDEEFSFDYRPFTTTTFAIEYAIFGQNPFINHLDNILLYFIVICLIYVNCLTLFKEYEFKKTISVVASFVFLIMPSHTEVVNNIKCRDELLVLLFSLISLWASLKLVDKVKFKYIFIFVVCVLLGMFCKKTAILTLAVIPLCLFFYRKLELKKAVISFIFIGLIPLVFSVIKGSLIAEKTVRFYYHFENPLYVVHFDLIDRLLIAMQTFGFYVKFFFIPYPFRAYYGFKTIDVYNPVDIYFVIGLIFIILSIWYYFKFRDKHFLFSLLLFMGCIFPFVNLITPVPGIVGERLSFYSSFGFCLMIAFILNRFLGNIDLSVKFVFLKKPLLYFLPIVIVSFLLVITRNSNWENQLKLFEHDSDYLKLSAKGNSLLGNQYFELLRNANDRNTGEKYLNKALNHYKLAVTADSSFYSAYNNAGVVYFSYLNDFKTARYLFTLAIRHKPNYPQAYENVANCYKSEKDYANAKHYYLESIKQNIMQYRAYLAIIQILFEEKKYKNALICSKIANKQFSNDYALVALEANCTIMQGDTLNAMPKFEAAYSLAPNKELSSFIATKYLELGDSLKYKLYKSY